LIFNSSNLRRQTIKPQPSYQTKTKAAAALVAAFLLPVIAGMHVLTLIEQTKYSKYFKVAGKGLLE
jgi:hypothetical protein